MAYVSSFAYCDSIQTEMTPQGPRPQIVNPLQVLMPVAVPSNYSFCISCNVAGFDDVSVENRVRVCFVAPSGKIVKDTDEIVFKVPLDQIKQTVPNAMQFNLQLQNVVLRETGIYTTEVYANGEKIGEYKIQVIVGDDEC